MAKTGKGQPAPMSSNLPGSFVDGNREGDRASSAAQSKLPGAFISMTAGANPEGPHMLDNGPRGDESVTTDQVGDGQKKRTVTGRDQSPYDVK